MNLELRYGEITMRDEELKEAPIKGVKPNKRIRIPAAVLRATMIVFGIVLALTPLAFWVAWSEQAWLLVIAVGIAAILGLLLCHWLIDDDRDAAHSGSAPSPRTGRVTASNKFLAELSRMGPWTYHNRITGHARFRMKMERLRKLLKSDKAK